MAIQEHTRSEVKKLKKRIYVAARSPEIQRPDEYATWRIDLKLAGVGV